ncbi:uncharacterized protein FTOL_09128 [Fusarium torulosum]|uniref:Uncharacterized protein n=1 Tax=Fusarium torulosum TaxID=33205 RepID=A0AAE8SKU1_9HYPO|nr:uncharacterized protein FTOL_09128 [Fusarium torulosum]
MQPADNGDNEADGDTVAVKPFVDDDDFFSIFESFIKNNRQQPNVKQGVNTGDNAEKFRQDAQDQLKTAWDPETLDKILPRLVSLNNDQIVQFYIALRKRLSYYTTQKGTDPKPKRNVEQPVPSHEIAQRAHDLESMCNKFNTHLLEQAEQHISNDEYDDDAAVLVGPVYLDQDFAKDNEEIPKSNAHTQFAAEVDSVQAVDTFPNEIVDVLGSVSVLDYAVAVKAAKAAMEVRLYVETEQPVLGTKAQQQSIYQLCVDGDTMDYEAKRKLWQSHQLWRHQESDAHSRFKQFSHRAQRFALDEGLDGVICEICARIVPDSIFLYQFKLVAIKADCNWWKDGSVDTQALAIAHGELKYAGAWYDDDFYGSAAAKKKRQNENRAQLYRRRSLEDATVVFSEENELQHPLPVIRKYPTFSANLHHESDPNWVDIYMEQAGRGTCMRPSRPYGHQRAAAKKRGPKWHQRDEYSLLTTKPYFSMTHC